ncbi:flagellar motor switch protein FliG [Maritimibacter alkaliphilus]|uniref:flagellar motor switch protein FliG n=1 Tax=Maritimibacter alkaliphilus TaxID=404236 RepID=UPI001C982F66|nr:FliG C-terminal domain-containing protein [Maritimibacter alkaliphilus]MBY6092721.1 flagellar motor switch protein FliG [Maritimibacter alkaliphilus]
MGTLAPMGGFGGRSAPADLTRRQKAAVIVRLLLTEGADLPLTDLPEEMQADLTRLMGTMRHVDRDTLTGVIEEFAGELEGLGLTFPRGVADALSALDGRISAHTAARLRKEAGVRQTGDPWERLRALEAKALLPILQDESTEVAAVMLSKLDTSKAAALLGMLPGARARRITYAVSQTTGITPEAVDRIGLSLATQIDQQPGRVFEKGPVERIGAILNQSTAATRDEVLGGLEEEDADFAEQVRKAIFTFLNIPKRIAARDVPKVVRGVDQLALVTALAAATGNAEAEAAAEFILGNMSARMAEQLREEAKDLGKVKPRDAEEAMKAVVAVIRELEAAGEILLLADEEEEA